MDFAISPALDALVGRARAFVDRELVPIERQVFADGWRASKGLLEEKRAAAREAGLFAPHRDRSLLDFAHLSEVLGRTPIGHFVCNCHAPDIGNMELLDSHGSEEQKARWLGPLLRGEIRSCFAMTEPDRPGSNPTWLETRARREGEAYVIDGRKWFTSSADGATFAIVMAVTDPDAAAHARASMIVVPLDTPGFRLVRNIRVMGEAGEDYASHGEVAFEGCRVPISNRIGGEGAGFMLAQDRLGPGRIHHCMRWIGICERALDLMCARAAKREIAPGKPLATRQVVQMWIAESRAEIDAARLLVLRTAWRIDAEGAHAARNDISAIKFLVAGVLDRVLDRAVQTWGAAGLTDETPLSYWYAHERAARIYDGPDEVHKTAVARRILRDYGVDVR